MRLANFYFGEKANDLLSDWLLYDDSIVDWTAFLEELVYPTCEFTVYIKQALLSDELTGLVNTKENNPNIRKRIIDALNRGMVNTVFYSAERISDLSRLGAQAQKFVIDSYKLKDWLLVKANRIVLENQYQGILEQKFSWVEAACDGFQTVTKRIDRRWKIATSAFRLAPSFLIAGVQRCGTSSLFYYLCQHPNIISPEQKELHFFNRSNYSGDLRYYRSFFPLRRLGGEMDITGEATPEYSFYPGLMMRIKEALPEIKIILLVRDPVQRAISHYYAQVSHRRPESFRLAIQSDQQIFGNRNIQDIMELDHHKRGQNYIARGRYIDYIPSIYQYFPRQSILLIRAEDMFSNNLDVVNHCLEFLEMPKLTFLRNENYTDISRKNSSLLKSLQSMPEKPNEDLVAELYNYFRPYNQMFYEFIQRDMKWDR